MKTKNFPDRRRQRQLSALERLADKTKAGISNAAHIAILLDRTAGDARGVRTKKDRSHTARFRNA